LPEHGLLALADRGSDRVVFWSLSETGIFNFISEVAVTAPVDSMAIYITENDVAIIVAHGVSVERYSTSLEHILPPRAARKQPFPQAPDTLNAKTITIPTGKLESRIEDMYNKFEEQMQKGCQDQIEVVRRSQIKA
jgi:hypothetical protein